MISGIDITLDTLKKIRSDFKGYIHLDAHNIVMTTYPDGRRLQGPIDDWFEWCTNCNTLQMNETELNIMTQEKLSEEEIADEILINEVNKTNALAVTRGKGGVSLYIPNASTPLSIERLDIRAIENHRFKDSTGCGDVFGAGFFYKNALSAQRDYIENMKFGNRLASAKSELLGVEDMVNLQHIFSPLLKGEQNI